MRELTAMLVVGTAAVLPLTMARMPEISAQTAQASQYHVIRNILLGGEGNWDYLTLDPDARRLYILATVIFRW